MKENITKFNLEAAFKALDELEIPVAEKGIKANRTPIKEAFADRTFAAKTNALIEDYYDINNDAELEQAKEDREDEIAKAKLARIEKIVDLDAESADDLLPSYVGKVIIQCPQCMTLFYKNQEDIEHSEENPDVVNINEVCQHCGNTSGYTLIGKVDKVGEDEAEQYDASAFDDNELDLNFEEEEPVEEEPIEEEPVEEDESTETDESDLDLDLDLESEEETDEPEVTEESFTANNGTALTEATDADVEIDAATQRVRELTKLGRKPLKYIFYTRFNDGTIDSLEKTDIKPAEIHELCKDVADADDVEGVYVSAIYRNENNKEEEIPLDKYTIDKTVIEFDEAMESNDSAQLNESAEDKELLAKLDKHNQYITYLQKLIEQDEKALESAKKVKDNEAVIKAIEKELLQHKKI